MAISTILNDVKKNNKKIPLNELKSYQRNKKSQLRHGNKKMLTDPAVEHESLGERQQYIHIVLNLSSHRLPNDSKKKKMSLK